MSWWGTGVRRHTVYTTCVGCFPYVSDPIIAKHLPLCDISHVILVPDITPFSIKQQFDI